MRVSWRTAAVAAVCSITLACAGGSTASAPAAPSTTATTPSVPPPAPVTILENTVGTGATGNNAPGQSFIAPGTYNNLRLNWVGWTVAVKTAPAGPVAVGTAYLLSAEYLSTQSGLSAATPGYVAASERIENDQYVFPPSATIEADDFAGGDGYICNPAPGEVFRKLGAIVCPPGGGSCSTSTTRFTDVDFRLVGTAK